MFINFILLLSLIHLIYIYFSFYSLIHLVSYVFTLSLSFSFLFIISFKFSVPFFIVLRDRIQIIKVIVYYNNYPFSFINFTTDFGKNFWLLSLLINKTFKFICFWGFNMDQWNITLTSCSSCFSLKTLVYLYFPLNVSLLVHLSSGVVVILSGFLLLPHWSYTTVLFRVTFQFVNSLFHLISSNFYVLLCLKGWKWTFLWFPV